MTVTLAGPGGFSLVLPVASVGADGNWSTSIDEPLALPEGAELTVTAAVDSAAGVPAVGSPATLLLDTTPPTLAIDAPLSIGDFLNADEAEAGINVTGTVDGNDGREVTVQIGDVSVIATQDGAGNWTAAFAPGALSGLPDGPADVAASTADAAGNPATADAPSVTVDLTPPEVVMAPLPFGNFFNLDVLENGFTVTGTASDSGSAAAVEGAEVVLLLQNGTNIIERSATVTGGEWSFTFTDADLAGFNEQTSSLTARLTDAAGNEESAARSFLVDVTPPELTVDAPGFGDFLGSDAATGEVVVTGTVSGNEGEPVTVAIGGVEVDAALGDGGVWTATFPAGALAGLEEGAAVFTASTSDPFGNPASAESPGFTVDFTAPEVTIRTVGDDGVADLAADEGFTVTGDVDDPTVGSVTVGFRGENYAAPVAGDGSWSVTIPAAALAGLAPTAALAVTATATDPAGNTAITAAEEVVTYLASAFSVTETGRAGDVVGLSLFADQANVGEFADPAGLSFESALFVPTSQGMISPPFTFGTGLLGAANDALIADGVLTIGAIGLDPGIPTSALFSFSVSMTESDAVLAVATIGSETNSALNEILLNGTPFGPSLALFGSAASDLLQAQAVDTTIRGRGGDDIIDVGAGGRHTVLFEPTVAENGDDLVIGFSLGAETALPDRIGFAGLDPSVLRGAGTDAQLLGAGDTVGTDTGFIVYTDVFTELSEAGLLPVLQSLSGLATGDVFYIMGSDGGNAGLARIELGTDVVDFSDVDATGLALFDQIPDLSGFTEDNILGFNLVT